MEELKNGERWIMVNGACPHCGNDQDITDSDPDCIKCEACCKEYRVDPWE